jgi:septal ring factor EnvC (AmiA/AmiB activator)
MGDRIATAAKIIAEFDGTIESADKILSQISAIRREVGQEITTLTKELGAIDGLADYIISKRNELAHNEKVELRKAKLIMENKRERVEAVLDAATAVLSDGIPTFSIEDIKHQLEKMRIDLGVSYPAAVIATILAADKRFNKTDTGLYQYVGKKRRTKGEK